MEAVKGKSSLPLLSTLLSLNSPIILFIHLFTNYYQQVLPLLLFPLLPRLVGGLKRNT
jgi:hypothetical protein